MIATIIIAASLALCRAHSGTCAVVRICNASDASWTIWSACLDRTGKLEACLAERAAMISGWAACHVAVDAHVIGK